MIGFLGKIPVLNDNNGKLSTKRLAGLIFVGLAVLISLSAVTNTLDNRSLRLGIIFLLVLDLSVILMAGKAIGDLKFKRK